jgi:hypothetical protein
MGKGFGGAIFDVDGVLVDSPHERAWREAFEEMMEGEWSDVRDQTTYSPEKFTPEVYQQVMSGKPRMEGARAVIDYFEVPDPQRRTKPGRTADGRALSLGRRHPGRRRRRPGRDDPRRRGYRGALRGPPGAQGPLDRENESQSVGVGLELAGLDQLDHQPLLAVRILL